MKTVSVTVTRTYTKSTEIEMVVPDDFSAENPVFTDEQDSEIEDGLASDSLNWDGDDSIDVIELEK